MVDITKAKVSKQPIKVEDSNNIFEELGNNLDLT